MENKYSRYYTFIKPIANNRRVRAYSSLVFSLIAILIFSVFAIKPTISTIIGIQKDVDQKNDSLSKLNAKTTDITQGIDNLNKIPPQTMAKLNNLLPNKTDVTALTDDLVTIAQENEASISALQYQPLDLVGEPNTLNPSPALKEISFTLNLQGDYQKVTTLLNAIKSSNRLITIDSINLNQPESGPLVTSINARAFYLEN